jgi:hypothetical protein
LTFDVTGGEAHEVKAYDELMQLHEIDPAKLTGHKGYDSEGVRNGLAERGIDSAAIQPQDANRLRSGTLRGAEPHRALPPDTRKTARAYITLCVGAAKLWIKPVNTAWRGILATICLDRALVWWI